MKTLLLIVAAVSLIANAILGYAFWQGSTRVPSAPTLHPGAHNATDSKSAGGAGSLTSPSAGARGIGAATAPTVTVVDPQLSAALKSGDPHKLAAALKEAGFPEKYVRNIMIWELGQTTRDQRVSMLREAIERPFWSAGSAADNAALDKALEDLDAKNLDITKEVFGGKIPPLGATTADQRRYAFLPADKFDAVYELVTDFNTQARSGPMNPEKRAALDEQMHAELAKILSPAEMELFDLNLSTTAQSLRAQMQVFQPTEQEFRAMYTARRALEQNSASPAERQTAETALNDQYRNILGDDRFAAFQRAQNRDYRAAFQVVQHYDLPVTNATEVYHLRQTANERLQEIRRNGDPAVVRAETQALNEEINARLTQLLGPQGAAAFAKMTPTFSVQSR